MLLSFILLADGNVLTQRRSSCSSTLLLFVPQTKDGPYLNLNLASKRYLYDHTKQPAEKHHKLTVDGSASRIVSRNWDAVFESSPCVELITYTRFDDVALVTRVE